VAISIHEVAHPDQYQPIWAEYCILTDIMKNECVFRLVICSLLSGGIPGKSRKAWKIFIKTM